MLLVVEPVAVPLLMLLGSVVLLLDALASLALLDLVIQDDVGLGVPELLLALLYFLLLSLLGALENAEPFLPLVDGLVIFVDHKGGVSEPLLPLFEGFLVFLLGDTSELGHPFLLQLYKTDCTFCASSTVASVPIFPNLNLLNSSFWASFMLSALSSFIL